MKERFDRELLFIYYQTSNIIFIKKLANRYFPIIEERLRANGVPEDFKYLCVAESNLQHAISKAGAVGFWQFMSYTAPGYNLTVSKDVDDRYNVTKATDAACKYLKNATRDLAAGLLPLLLITVGREAMVVRQLCSSRPTITISNYLRKPTVTFKEILKTG